MSICMAGFGAQAQKSEVQFIRQNVASASVQLKNMLRETDPKSLRYPRTTDAAGKLKTTGLYDWTGGFFPGSLWYAYEETKDAQLKDAAVKWTESMEPAKTFFGHHDVGFLMYCSYGNAYRIDPKPEYKEVLIETARSLCKRYDPKVGSIKSWDQFKSWHGKTIYKYPVIIDNMMNLELLFFAYKETGDPLFKKVAIDHAEKTRLNHIRPDFSTYHVVSYDSTGKVLSQETAQGYADNSTWSRGQAWAMYGFTLMYRETKNKLYLETAQKLADFYLKHPNLPADKIPYWDFNDKQSGYEPGVNSNVKKYTGPMLRDASAGAIIASTLLELSTYLGKDGGWYRQQGVTMLHSLASPAYQAKPGTNGNFILEHSVGSLAHGNEIDVPLVYADYYYLEALRRYDNLLNKRAVLN